MESLTEFVKQVRSSIENGQFVKVTLSKPAKRAGDLQNIYVRQVEIKGALQLSFTFHFKTNDQTKNFSIESGLNEIDSQLNGSFHHAILFTTELDVALRISKKGHANLVTTRPNFIEAPAASHDRQKLKRTGHQDQYLIALGILDAKGDLIPKMADKFRQINKYLEIIESLIKSVSLPSKISVVDMGSGKGYLTFALYDYLKNKLSLNVSVTGIELRKDLTDYCNTTAKACGFDDLRFDNLSIEAFTEKHVDIVIALHACDTATDDAIAKAIAANASLIVCAPCCHKQIRQQVKGREQESPLLKYGIFKERQFEMVTDTIRALILERKSYDTKIFEFISNEHTRKNVLLVGIKTSLPVEKEALDTKIDTLKKAYQIDYHYLEKLV